ncbi:MAG: DMP19 family protein [Alteromonadales bacterium]|nr:DMP19 family protein [Alteromonadales bacterium]
MWSVHILLAYEVFEEVSEYVSNQQFDSELNEQVSTFNLVRNFNLEVDNGGLHQFFFNYTGENSLETLRALNTVGLFEHAKLLSLAIDQFPSAKISAQTNERRDVLNKINVKHLEKLDEQIYNLENEFDEKLLKFVNTNLKAVLVSIEMPKDILKADDAFRVKQYQKVVGYLGKHEKSLPSSKLTKLKFAIKKCGSK